MNDPQHDLRAARAADHGLYGYFAQTMRRVAARRLITDDTRDLSGDELAGHVERWAAALHALGVGQGDRIAVQTRKSLQQLLLYLAAMRLGAIYLPLNEGYGIDELGYFLSDATPRLFICDPADEAACAGIAQPLGVALATLGADGAGSMADAAAGNHPPAPVPHIDQSDIAAIVYTSGTTGRSKGAMVTHGNLISNALALATAWQVGPDDVLLHALPLYHIHGLFISFNTMMVAGASTILLPAFAAPQVVERLPEATLFMGVPTYYTRLLKTPGFDRAACAGIRLFVSGSAPLLPETFERFEALTGHRILERYGMSECGVISTNPVDGARRPGSVGRPLHGVELRITDADGQPIAAPAIGNIEVRGPNLFAGYWGMPDKTRAEHRADGHFITGDLGHLDEDGYVHIVGRAKDMVISGGLNVYPAEIEEALNLLPGVGESAVIGLPHADFGEAVAAAITCADQGSPPDPADLVAALRGRLAAFKIPKAIFLVDELPRNAMGKVQKSLLRQTYARTFEDS